MNSIRVAFSSESANAFQNTYSTIQNKFLPFFNFLKKIHIQSIFETKVFRQLNSKAGIFTVSFVSAVSLGVIAYVLVKRSKNDELVPQLNISQENLNKNIMEGNWSEVMNILDHPDFVFTTTFSLHDVAENPPKGTENQIIPFFWHPKLKGYLKDYLEEEKNGKLPIEVALQKDEYNDFTLLLFRETSIKTGIDLLSKRANFSIVKHWFFNARKDKKNCLLAIKFLDLINQLTNQLSGLRTTSESNWGGFTDWMFHFINDCPWGDLSREEIYEIEFLVRTAFIFHKDNNSENPSNYLSTLIEKKVRYIEGRIKVTKDPKSTVKKHIGATFRNVKQNIEENNLKNEILCVALEMNPFPLTWEVAKLNAAELKNNKLLSHHEGEIILNSMKVLIEENKELAGSYTASTATITHKQNTSSLFERWVAPKPNFYPNNRQAFIDSVSELLGDPNNNSLGVWYHIHDILNWMRYENTADLLETFRNLTRFEQISEKEKELIGRIIARIQAKNL